MIFGYARVSNRDQKTAAQHDALTAAGAEQIFTDTISGSIRDRPQLDRMLEMLRKGDVVVVTKFDRLARSIIDLISIPAGISCSNRVRNASQPRLCCPRRCWCGSSPATPAERDERRRFDFNRPSHRHALAS